MTKEEKINQLKKITEEQFLYVKKALVIAKKGVSKYQAINLKRAFRVVAYACWVHSLEVEKHIILSQITDDHQPKFPLGGIVMERNQSEKIITSVKAKREQIIPKSLIRQIQGK